ncbi:hypothetical protein [Cerasicoccus arenae]|uniref:Uncharacterized protein n=1 Tax=Cerasicoccus arenae TaxID=424488 RepID=A0A8J3DC78_9BACT|nr:hypothetical protein [Cerasicoccus arenae]MBK1858214.1 hypothetical protein [Cerasicoccus arenae]GHC01944.1 hypothetical protein GCM10007047_18010 [Cerasicoccus arenae]
MPEPTSHSNPSGALVSAGHSTSPSWKNAEAGKENPVSAPPSPAQLVEVLKIAEKYIENYAIDYSPHGAATRLQIRNAIAAGEQFYVTQN